MVAAEHYDADHWPPRQAVDRHSGRGNLFRARCVTGSQPGAVIGVGQRQVGQCGIGNRQRRAAFRGTAAQIVQSWIDMGSHVSICRAVPARVERRRRAQPSGGAPQSPPCAQVGSKLPAAQPAQQQHTGLQDRALGRADLRHRTSSAFAPMHPGVERGHRVGDGGVIGAGPLKRVAPQVQPAWPAHDRPLVGSHSRVCASPAEPTRPQRCRGVKRGAGGGPRRRPRCGPGRRAWPGSATRERWRSSRPCKAPPRSGGWSHPGRRASAPGAHAG